MGHFRSIWGHLKLNFSILDLHFFDFSKSVRNRPENTPGPSQNHPQTIPNPSQNFRFLVRNFRIFLMDFWWIFHGFLMDFYSGEARGLVFWAMDPVWSPPQAPGDASGSSELGRTLQKNASGSSELGRTLQKNDYYCWGNELSNTPYFFWNLFSLWSRHGPFFWC